MAKGSFVLYNDIRAPVEQLTLEERGALFTAILNYTEFGTLPAFHDNGGLSVAFAFIRADLDRDAARWEKKSKARSDAGKKGMETRWGGAVITTDNNA